MEVLESHAFRLTRNEDLEVEEDNTENLLQALEKELMRRRFGPPVRLEVEESIDREVLDLLVRELKIGEAEVYPLPGPLDLTGLFRIHGLDRPELKYPKFVAGTHRDLAEVESASAPDVFAALREPRRPAPTPPVPLLLHLRPGLPGAGGRRPGRPGDQADPVPDLGRLPHSRRPHRGRRGRQAGPGPGRDQGPLRRARQHQVGPQAGGGRLPRRLRPGRPEDPLQAVAGGPPGGRDPPPLQPRRHRQLPPEDGPPLRGPRPPPRPRPPHPQPAPASASDLRRRDRSGRPAASCGGARRRLPGLEICLVHRPKRDGLVAPEGQARAGEGPARRRHCARRRTSPRYVRGAGRLDQPPHRSATSRTAAPSGVRYWAAEAAAGAFATDRRGGPRAVAGT
ncbi:Polyphosphate kinase [Streptomyces fumanus]